MYDTQNPSASLMPYIYALENQVDQLRRSNADFAYRLGQRDQQLCAREFAEQAYTEVLNYNNRLSTMSKSGRPIPVIDTIFSRVLRLVCETTTCPFEMIYLELLNGARFLINQADFENNRRLLHEIQKNGINITFHRNQAVTANLIRKGAYQIMQMQVVPLFKGWEFVSGVPSFTAFSPFSTHRTEKSLISTVPSPERSQEISLLAVRRFSAVFQVFRNPLHQQLFIAWYHAAFLCSLLTQGDHFALGLYVFADHALLTKWLHLLLCWFGDDASHLADPPHALYAALSLRKDEPAVIMDTGHANDANEKTISKTISTGKIASPTGSSTPLRSFVVLLSDRISPLLSSTDLLVVDFTPEDCCIDLCSQQCADFPCNQNYLLTFADYTTRHWADLEHYLQESSNRFLLEHPSGRHQDAFATLSAVYNFVCDFFHSYLGSEAAHLTAGRSSVDSFGHLFKLHNSKSDVDDLADAFCFTAAKCLEKHRIHISESAVLDDAAAVYIDNGDYCFPREAFTIICHQMGTSAPIVGRALLDAGLLHGKPTNATTVQSRISLFDAAGNRHSVGVYRLPQEALQIHFD